MNRLERILCVIGTILVTAAIIYMCSKSTETKTRLYVYNWSDYMSPEVIDKFQKENNCEVVVDTFADNETMLAKLMSGACGYDVIFPSSYIVPVLVKNNLIQKLDPTKLADVFENFDDKYSAHFHDYTLTYTVPYAFSVTGVAYRKDKVDEKTLKHSWQDLKNPAYNKRVSLFRDVREMLGIGLLANGFSVNTKNEDEINKALDYILDLKKYVVKLDNELYRTALVSAELLACIGYNSDIGQLQVDNPDCPIGFYVPNEGSTCCWDEMAILSTSKNVDLAHKFINFLYDAEIAAENMEYVCSAVPNKNMWEHVDDVYKNNELVNVSTNVLNKLELIKDVGKDLDLYNRAWDKFMSKQN